LEDETVDEASRVCKYGSSPGGSSYDGNIMFMAQVKIEILIELTGATNGNRGFASPVEMCRVRASIL